MDDLIAQAEAMGLRVKWVDLGRRTGELRRSGLVLINDRKSALTQRCALAHEMGHWVHGHDWSAMHDRRRDELQADTYAAELLIRPVDYALAERLHDGHAGAIARELDVSTRLIEIWRTQVLRRPSGAVAAYRHLRAV